MQQALSRRVLYIAIALVAALALWVAALGAPSKAAAVGFCGGVYLAPYGQGGDRCWGPAVNGLDKGWVKTQERAGCVTIADGANNLLTSWVCGPAGSWPGLAASAYLFNTPGTWRKAVIRNNNLSLGGNFGGEYGCYPTLC